MAKAKTSKKATKKFAKKAAKKVKTTKGKVATPAPITESELLRPLMGLRNQIEDTRFSVELSSSAMGGYYG